jgi:hypothetical protein
LKEPWKSWDGDGDGLRGRVRASGNRGKRQRWRSRLQLNVAIHDYCECDGDDQGGTAAGRHVDAAHVRSGREAIDRVADAERCGSGRRLGCDTQPGAARIGDCLSGDGDWGA